MRKFPSIYFARIGRVYTSLTEDYQIEFSVNRHCVTMRVRCGGSCVLRLVKSRLTGVLNIYEDYVSEDIKNDSIGTLDLFFTDFVE